MATSVYAVVTIGACIIQHQLESVVSAWWWCHPHYKHGSFTLSPCRAPIQSTISHCVSEGARWQPEPQQRSDTKWSTHILTSAAHSAHEHITPLQHTLHVYSQQGMVLVNGEREIEKLTWQSQREQKRRENRDKQTYSCPPAHSRNQQLTAKEGTSVQQQ